MHVPIYPGRGTWPDWNNPEILERDRLPAHASLVPYPDQNSCRHALEKHRRYLSPSVLPLNGAWDFRYYASLLQLPENILSFRSGFERRVIPETAPILPTLLPSDTLPFLLDPPHVPSEQPVLVYRRTCRLPLLWSSQRKRIVIQGIRSACHVFVNGKIAGYTQGSCLQADFDITSLLHDGDNELFIFVYPYHCGSYLEKQPDRPWMGLIREISLEALPALTIHDLKVKTVWLAEEEAWRLDLSVLLASCRIALEQPVVRATLRHQDEPLHQAGWTVTMRPADPEQFAAPVQTTGQLNASLLLRDIEPWNDEQPVLYDLYVSLEDRHGRDLICLHQPVGFRSLTLEDGCLAVNGRPVRLKAVRWSCQDHADPITDIPGLIAAFRRYKQAHFNAIWFRHEPPDPIVLDLCDVYGFYVIEDAPLSIQDPAWIRSVRQIKPDLPLRWAQDRLLRLMRRDQNHPCIILWSCDLFLLGPDADPDCVRLAFQLAGQARNADPQRFLHGLDVPDLGRFLDAWQEQAGDQPADLSWLRKPDPGEAGWCFFDHDSANDMLRSIGSILRPIDIQPVNPIVGSFLIENHMSWSETGLYQLSWELLRQGRAILSGELDNIHAEPGHNQQIELWYGDQAFADEVEYIVRFSVRLARALLWNEKDSPVSMQEFCLQKADNSTIPVSGQGGRLRLESERHHLIISGPRFWLVFNRIHATLESWRTGDRELLAARGSQAGGTGFMQLPPLSGLRCCLMRQPEPTDGSDWPRWLRHGYDQLQTQIVSIEDGCDGKNAVVDMIANLGVPGKPPLFSLTLRYEIAIQGAVRLFASLSPLQETALPPPCFGLCLNPARTCRDISWYGKGPARSLCRLPGTGATGHYEQALADLARPGRGPGAFKDVRRLTLRDDSGVGLAITSDHHFAFDVAAAPDLIFGAGLHERSSDPSRLVLQILHQSSLSCRPMAEPLKMILDIRPVV